MFRTFKTRLHYLLLLIASRIPPVVPSTLAKKLLMRNLALGVRPQWKSTVCVHVTMKRELHSPPVLAWDCRVGAVVYLWEGNMVNFIHFLCTSPFDLYLNRCTAKSEISYGELMTYQDKDWEIRERENAHWDKIVWCLDNNKCAHCGSDTGTDGRYPYCSQGCKEKEHQKIFRMRQEEDNRVFVQNSRGQQCG